MKFAFACMVSMFWMIGCAQQTLSVPPEVPPQSILVNQGTGRLFVQAMAEGAFYVYDADTATLIAMQPVSPHQRMILDPAAGSMTIEGRPTYADPTRYSIKLGDHSIREIPIAPRHTHRIYFAPGKFILPAPAAPVQNTVPTTQT